MEPKFETKLILSNYYNEVKNGVIKTLFFNSNSNLPLEYLPDFPEAEVLTYNLDEDINSEPYFPFLFYIKNSLNGLSENEVSKFLKKSKTYYLLHNVFKGYFFDKLINREEEIHYEEVEYELTEIHHSIMSMLIYISQKRPLIFVINNATSISNSSLKFIEYILKNTKSGRILFIFSINKHKLSTDYYDDFITLIEKNSFVINLYNLPENNAPDIAYPLPDLKDTLKKAKMYLDLLSYSECKKQLDIIDSLKASSTELFSDNDFFCHYHILGDYYNYIREEDNALLYYNSILNNALSSNNTFEIAESYRKIGLVYYKKGDADLAYRFATQSIKLFKTIDDERKIVETLFLLFLVCSRLRATHPELLKTYFFELIPIALERKMYNIVSKCYAIIVSESIIYNSYEERLHYCNEAIKIAEKHKNNYKLASLYHNKGMINSSFGNHKESFKYYEKSKLLKIKIGNKLEIIRIYNGIGYAYFLNEDYKKAFRYFNKALYYLKDSRNNDEIGVTFFNIGITCFCAHNFKNAANYFEKTLSVLKILKVREIPFHSQGGIYSILGFSYLKINNYLKALECFNKLKELPIPAKTDDIFFFKIFTGLLSIFQENYVEAKLDFLEAYKAVNSPELKILLPDFYYEYGLVLKKLGEYEEAKEIFNKGILICDELNYKRHKLFFLQELQYDVVIPPFNLESKIFDLNAIIELGKQQLTFNKLHKRISEINFLNNLQQILIHHVNSSRELIINVLDLINNNFLFDEIYGFERDKSWKLFYPEKQKLFTQNFINELSKDKKERLFNINNNDFCKKNQINSMIYIPIIREERVYGITFFISRKAEISLSEDDLQVLSIAVKQTNAALMKKELEEKLEFRNIKLVESLNNLKSIERLTSVIYSEKVPENAINYVLTVFVSTSGLNYKSASYFEYENGFLFDKILYHSNDKNLFHTSDTLKSNAVNYFENDFLKKSIDSGEMLTFSTKNKILKLTDELSFKNFCILPVKQKENIYGVIILESHTEKITEDEKDIFKIFITNLAIYLENKRLEKEELKTEKLETLMKLASSIVHEVKTPLVGIRGLADLIKKKNQDEKTQYYMTLINQETERIDEMATQLLEYSGKSEYKYKKENIRLIDVIQDTVKTKIKDIEDNSISLSINIPENIMIFGDKFKLMKAFSNLLKNSIEYSKGYEDSISISAIESGGQIEIEIIDMGIGVPEEMMNTVFEPLVTSKIQGTGLGLPIAKNIITNHNGTIEIFSNEGVGTSIIIKL